MDRSALRWESARSLRHLIAPGIIPGIAILLIVALIGLLAHFTPARSILLPGIAAFSPYLMVGAPLAALLFAVSKQWIGAVLALTVTIAVAGSQLSPYIPANGRPGPVTVVVMTSNLRLGLADPTDIVRAVRRHHVDVLMLQELTAHAQARLQAAGLSSPLPYHLSDPRDTGDGVSGSDRLAVSGLLGPRVVTGKWVSSAGAARSRHTARS